jgi:hypothetical protein
MVALYRSPNFPRHRKFVGRRFRENIKPSQVLNIYPLRSGICRILGENGRQHLSERCVWLGDLTMAFPTC